VKKHNQKLQLKPKPTKKTRKNPTHALILKSATVKTVSS